MIASTIAKAQIPTLILVPNKVLAAQIYNELKEFLPENAVEYFVSYYDYYLPESYKSASDTYIEKVKLSYHHFQRHSSLIPSPIIFSNTQLNPSPLRLGSILLRL